MKLESLNQENPEIDLPSIVLALKEEVTGASPGIRFVLASNEKAFWFYDDVNQRDLELDRVYHHMEHYQGNN